jgi:hypothetical protein
MKFVLDKTFVPSFFIDDLPRSTELLSFYHEAQNFKEIFEKKLTHYDISTDFLVRNLDKKLGYIYMQWNKTYYY